MINTLVWNMRDLSDEIRFFNITSNLTQYVFNIFIMRYWIFFSLSDRWYNLWSKSRTSWNSRRWFKPKICWSAIHFPNWKVDGLRYSSLFKGFQFCRKQQFCNQLKANIWWQFFLTQFFSSHSSLPDIRGKNIRPLSWRSG